MLPISPEVRFGSYQVLPLRYLRAHFCPLKEGRVLILVCLRLDMVGLTGCIIDNVSRPPTITYSVYFTFLSCLVLQLTPLILGIQS